MLIFFIYILHLKNDVPTFVVDAPGGGGKISLQPNYVLSHSPEKIVLRNFEGVITTYPEPEKYIPGRADEYFNEIYPDFNNSKPKTGVSSLLSNEQSHFAPGSVQRYKRRAEFQSNPSYETLKDKREKRDQLKEKKYKAQLKQNNKEGNE